MKTADQILKDHEDANEMHFHQVDREWIIKAMEEYAASRKPWIRPLNTGLSVQGKSLMVCIKCRETKQTKRKCFECNDDLNKEELFCGYCRRQ